MEEGLVMQSVIVWSIKHRDVVVGMLWDLALPQQFVHTNQMQYKSQLFNNIISRTTQELCFKLAGFL